MEGNNRLIFYKYCGGRCVKKTSRTMDNSGRVFWACPLEFAGQGWMEWFDYAPSPQGREKRTMQERLFCVERILQGCEEELIICKSERERLVQDNVELRQELVNHKSCRQVRQPDFLLLLHPGLEVSQVKQLELGLAAALVSKLFLLLFLQPVLRFTTCLKVLQPVLGN
ncbi:hypothetical protein LIER_31609 [Lithospermum erythrorhizon]|uniref:Zinc finger GRF-type domain-containing protein n=1 Tax=Lithospermum erythrorhizon TaxID=34254 RepID=A0AAV3RWT1_LITER